MKRAGLMDTVYSGTMIEGDGFEPETKEKYLEALVYAYENPEWLQKESEKGKSEIKDFYWSNIAKLWEKEWLN
jgi:glycosyltransferase involved in cell wall biosynthesis